MQQVMKFDISVLHVFLINFFSPLSMNITNRIDFKIVDSIMLIFLNY